MFSFVGRNYLIYMGEKLDRVVILITKWDFKDLVNKMKLACEKATHNLIMNIKTFPKLWNDPCPTIGIIYFQFWVDILKNVEEWFSYTCLNVIICTFYAPKSISDTSIWILGLLSTHDHDLQASFFKLTMVLKSKFAM